MAQKTNKSLAKRIKITKNGKIKVRPKAQNHFNAKESNKKRLSKRGTKHTLKLSAKDKSRFLPHA